MSKIHRKILDIHDYMTIGNAIYNASFDVVGEYDIEDSYDSWKEEEELVTDILNKANIEKPDTYRSFHIASYDNNGKYIGCERNMIWGKGCCGLDGAEHDVRVECDVANRNQSKDTLWLRIKEWARSFGDDEIEEIIIGELYKVADRLDHVIKES